MKVLLTADRQDPDPLRFRPCVPDRVPLRSVFGPF